MFARDQDFRGNCKNKLLQALLLRILHEGTEQAPDKGKEEIDVSTVQESYRFLSET